jgi:hypothetical protein
MAPPCGRVILANPADSLAGRLDSGTQVHGYFNNMHEPNVAIVCTLSPNQTSQRLAEFERLFANHLRELTRPSPRQARFIFQHADEIEDATRDLFAREHQCCAFFDFVVERQATELIVRAEVPAGAEAILNELATIARRAATRGADAIRSPGALAPGASGLLLTDGPDPVSDV